MRNQAGKGILSGLYLWPEFLYNDLNFFCCWLLGFSPILPYGIINMKQKIASCVGQTTHEITVFSVEMFYGILKQFLTSSSEVMKLWFPGDRQYSYQKMKL